MSLRTESFPRTHEKDHATLATEATTAKGKPMKAFFAGIHTITLTKATTNVPVINPSRSLETKVGDTQPKP